MWNIVKWEIELMLGGYEGVVVWSVIVFDEMIVLIGCVDKNIRIFDLRKVVGGEV